MATHRLTVRLEPAVAKILDALAAEKDLTTSELVRQAIARLIEEQASETESAFDAAQRAGIVGAADDLPEDLSTNAEHFQGFGVA